MRYYLGNDINVNNNSKYRISFLYINRFILNFNLFLNNFLENYLVADYFFRTI